MSSWDGFDEVVAIADAGTFAGGAKLLGMSASQMSRTIARLEERLNTQLFVRTTRSLCLTDSGHAFVEQCRNILQERDDLLSQIGGFGSPQGNLRMTCSTALGEKFVTPLISQLINMHSKLSVTLDLTNRVIDIVGEGYDIGIRTGHIADGRLVACQVAARPIVVCASGAYLTKAGTPRSVADLAYHACLVGTNPAWHFQDRGSSLAFIPTGRFRGNSGTAIVDAAIAGMGVCQLPRFYVQQAIERKLLVPILEQFTGDPEPIWIVYPRRRHLQPKVRCAVELLLRELQGTIDAGGHRCLEV